MHRVGRYRVVALGSWSEGDFFMVVGFRGKVEIARRPLVVLVVW